MPIEDSYIAATAVRYSLTIVTGNERYGNCLNRFFKSALKAVFYFGALNSVWRDPAPQPASLQSIQRPVSEPNGRALRTSAGRQRGPPNSRWDPSGGYGC